MLQPHPRILLSGERHRTTIQIPNLTSVELLVEVVDVALDGGELVTVVAVELVVEVHEDLLALEVAEVGVSDGEVDAGLDGGVEGFDAVGGEDEDALVVFHDPEED